jgi:hypothetical protein
MCLLIILALSMPVFFLTSPAAADTPDPDETPTLYDFRIYHHVIEEDDFLAVVPYRIPYATAPDIGIDKTFIFRMTDTDNVTELGTILAYPYYNSGYSEGVISFYFQASSNVTWEELFPVSIIENPALFDTPEIWSFSPLLTDYSSFDTQETNRQLLKDRVIELAQYLTTIWSVELVDQTDAGTVLSAYGEAYFRNAIPGIQTMCPELFYVQISNVDLTERSWDFSFAEILSNTFQGTWVWNTMTGFAGLWGLETRTAMGFVTLGIGVIIMCIVAGKYKQVAPGYLFFDLVLIWGSLNGWFSPTLHALIAFLHVLIGGIVFFLNK